MKAPRLVPGVEARMIAPAGAAGVGEDEEALVAFHEGLRLDQIGARSPVLEPLAAVIPGDEPPGSAGDFGDGVGAEAFDQRNERGGDRRQRAELFAQSGARLNCRPATSGTASDIGNRPPA